MRIASVLATLCLTLCLCAPLTLTRAAGADVLWDNGLPDGRNGLSSCYWPSYPLDREVVDDFDVGGPGWLVQGGHFRLVTLEGHGPDVIEAVKAFFYRDIGNKPSTERFAERDCAFNAYLTGDHYFDRPEIAVDLEFHDVALAPGKWWVCFQPQLEGVGNWLTAENKEESIWVSYPDIGYPKWTYGYDVFDDYYDVAFQLTGDSMSRFPDAVIDLPVDDVVIYQGGYVEFAGTATDENGEIVDWLWTFGEGSGIEDMHVEDPGLVQFNNIGVFEVTFNAQDNDGNWDPIPDQRTVTVEAIAPDAVIDLPTDDVFIRPGEYVEFAGTATDENGEIVDWLWTFGEGSGIDDMHVEDPGLVQFNNVGVFTVTFDAQDDDGNWDPSPDTRRILVGVLWDNGPPDGRGGLGCMFWPSVPRDWEVVDDFDVDNPGWLVQGGDFRLVTFEGHGPDVIQAVKAFFYRDIGNKPSTERFAERDCTFSPYLTGDYYFGAPEIAVDLQFAPVELPPGKWWICFQPELEDYGYWLTTEGHGESVWVSQPDLGRPKWTYGYDAFGYYCDVSFHLTGDIMSGRPDAVIDLPVGDVLIYPGDHVEFAGTATDEDGEIVDWLWTFGEGSGIPDMHVEDPGLVQFNNIGVFDVTFNAQDNDGNWDPIPDERTITVDPGYPDAVIDLPEGVVVIRPGDYVEFAGTATDENGEIVDWLWTFGEGSGIDDMHVEDPGLVQFNNLGVFTITFNAQDDDGNWDPAPDQRTIRVTPEGVMYVDTDSPGPEHDGLSWDTAYLTIEEGIQAATPYGEVWVADGTYVENVVMGEGVAIYGGFLGAEPGGYEDSRDQRDFVGNVTTIDGKDADLCVKMAIEARVDGFTITTQTGEFGVYCYKIGESGTIANNIVTGHGMCGVYCEMLASPMVVGNVVLNNGGSGWIGGIHAQRSSSPTIAYNTVSGNAGQYGGGVCWGGDTPALIIGNVITDNSADYRGGGLLCSGPSIVTNNIVARNSVHGVGGGVDCEGAALLTNNTIVGNRAYVDVWGDLGWGGGIFCDGDPSPTAANNIVVGNSAEEGGGIYCYDGCSPILWHNNFWNNSPDDYSGCEPGEGDISEDPRFVDPEGGDFHLKHGSPCIDAGDNDAPGLPEYDFEGDPRIMDGDGDETFVVDIGADEHPPDECVFTEAPDPEPYCEGALFGDPAAGYPGWVWFSIPLDPADCCGGADCYDPSVLLGFSCGGGLWYWDKHGNWAQVYQPPFLEWELSAGDGYLLYIESAVENPAYHGVYPEMPFEFRLGRMGWTWIGMPGLAELGYPDFMSSVQVEYPVGGVIRTADEDYNQTPNNWMSWGWIFWDTYGQAPQTFTPYAEFGNNTCYPWIGYRVWVNVGEAVDEPDPDQVTLIWPRPGG